MELRTLVFGGGDLGRVSAYTLSLPRFLGTNVTSFSRWVQAKPRPIIRPFEPAQGRVRS